jgi:hypothetical protein
VRRSVWPRVKLAVQLPDRALFQLPRRQLCGQVLAVFERIEPSHHATGGEFRVERADRGRDGEGLRRSRLGVRVSSRDRHDRERWHRAARATSLDGTISVGVLDAATGDSFLPLSGGMNAPDGGTTGYGVISVIPITCQDSALPGATIASSHAGPDAVTSYLVKGVPSTQATMTDASGVGSIANHATGRTTVTVKVEGKRIGSADAIVRRLPHAGRSTSHALSDRGSSWRVASLTCSRVERSHLAVRSALPRRGAYTAGPRCQRLQGSKMPIAPMMLSPRRPMPHSRVRSSRPVSGEPPE